MDLPLYDQLIAEASRTTGKTAESAETGGEFVERVQSTFAVLWDIILTVPLAILIVVVFYILGKLLAARIVRSLQKAKGESLYPDMVSLVNRLTIFGSLFIGIAAVLQFIFQLDFLQIVGFFGLGVSFAFKDLLENLIAGAVIIIQNRFRVGDFIMIGDGGIKGKIMEIETRATVLKAVDGTEVVIPNSELMMKAITTFTAHHSRRIEFTVNIDLDADVEKAMRIAVEIVKKKDRILKKPMPHVVIRKLGESRIPLTILFWIDPKDKEKSWILTRSELIAEVKAAFDREGILIAYPMYTYFDKKREVERGGARSAESASPLREV